MKRLREISNEEHVLSMNMQKGSHLLEIRRADGSEQVYYFETGASPVVDVSVGQLASSVANYSRERRCGMLLLTDDGRVNCQVYPMLISSSTKFLDFEKIQQRVEQCRRESSSVARYTENHRIIVRYADLTEKEYIFVNDGAPVIGALLGRLVPFTTDHERRLAGGRILATGATLLDYEQRTMMVVSNAARHRSNFVPPLDVRNAKIDNVNKLREHVPKPGDTVAFANYFPLKYHGVINVRRQIAQQNAVANTDNTDPFTGANIHVFKWDRDSSLFVCLSELLRVLYGDDGGKTICGANREYTRRALANGPNTIMFQKTKLDIYDTMMLLKLLDVAPKTSTAQCMVRTVEVDVMLKQSSCNDLQNPIDWTCATRENDKVATE